MPETEFATWPVFGNDEQDAALAVLRSGKVNYWTGEQGRSFEKEFADWVGSAHAVATANGTLALDIIWKALGIGPGDEVICTPRTFQASASSIVMAGARPVFADVDPDSQNITPRMVAPLITERTRAILCVHLAGWPCDMSGFLELANDRRLLVVEDCAQAHGARCDGRMVGTFGTASAWSFCQDKIMSTGGEGGAITIADHYLWQDIWSLKDHGKSWDAVHKKVHLPGFRWVHEAWGTNARMTEFQAAIGRIQLGRMQDWHDARSRNASALTAGLSGVSALRIPEPPGDVTHAWYRYYCFVRPEALRAGWNRDRILAAITEAGVPCFSGSCPEVYRELSFERAGLAPSQRLPNAMQLGDTSIALLVHPTLTAANIDKAVQVVSGVMTAATR